MKYSIVYNSQTGNTQMLAESIKEVLCEHKGLYMGKANGEYIDADFIFVGFWTDRGKCDNISSEFLNTLKNKKVFLFGTAGFGGSQEYYDKILLSAKENLDSSNTVLGSFMCQGKMPITVRQRFEKMMTEVEADSKFKNQIDNFDKAVSHPDSSDFDRLKKEIINIMSNLK